MAPTFASAERQAELLKQEGNIFFKKDRIGAAIEAYTERSQAITLCPDRPVYWTNRAICHRKRSEWDKVERDCRRALELDSGSVKDLSTLKMTCGRYEQGGVYYLSQPVRVATSSIEIE